MMTPEELRAQGMAALEVLPEPQRSMAKLLVQAAYWVVDGKVAGMHVTLVMSNGQLLCADRGASPNPDAIDPRQTHAAPEARQ